jgi:hypothetical protein
VAIRRLAQRNQEQVEVAQLKALGSLRGWVKAMQMAMD